MITYVITDNETVTLLSIYDKSEQANISDKNLKQLIEENKNELL